MKENMKKLTQAELLDILENRTPGYDLDKMAELAGFDDFFDYTEDEALEEFVEPELITTRSWGGKREGAGGQKPKLPESEKRKAVTMKLHPKVIKCLKAQKKAQSKIVEELICEKYSIKL